MPSPELSSASYPCNAPARDNEVDHCIQQNLQTLESLERAIWQGDHIGGLIANATQVMTIPDTNSKFENVWKWAESTSVPSPMTNEVDYTEGNPKETYRDARKAVRKAIDSIRRVEAVKQ